MPTVLQTQSLSKKYGHTRALKDLTLEVGQGQIFGLLGPNGSGKTTTLGIILGCTRPSHGSYAWFGGNHGAASRRRVGALLEAPCFYPWFSGEHNLRIVATIRGVASPHKAIDKALETVGLTRRGREKVSGFSLGMKQRLAIAATLLGDPEVLVLDEPANGVDAEGIAEIRTLVKNLGAEGKTVILASHILDEVEKVCSHIGILRKGELIETGPIENVLGDSNQIEVAADNHELLRDLLHRFPDAKEIVESGTLFRIKLVDGTSVAALSRFITSQGAVLTHLNQKKTTLESHFLTLMER